MGKKSAPPAPDYTAAANAQGAANSATAIQQSNLNNPNMITPYGTQTYTGPTDGSGRGTLTQTLSPQQQALLDASNQAEQSSLGILNGDMGNISSALSGPFGLAGAPVSGFDPNMPIGQTQTNLDPNSAGAIQRNLNFSGSPGLVGTDQATRQLVDNATYQQGAQYLDPQYAQLHSDLTSSLANQGITSGSAASDRANLNLNQQQQKAYSDLNDTAITAGNAALAQEQAAALANRGQISGETQAAGQFANAAQAQNFSNILQAMQANNAGVAQQANIASTSTQLQNAARNQAYNEYTQNRTMPINMLNSLLSSSQVQNPQFQPTTPTSITPAPILQGAQLQGQQSAAQYSANQAKLGSLYSGLGSIAGGALTHSDRRLKTKVVAVGSYGPFTLYEYDIAGRRERGVMADEVERLVPQAVSVGFDGFQRVNYSMIGLDHGRLQR